jgi:hypothetical protein
VAKRVPVSAEACRAGPDFCAFVGVRASAVDIRSAAAVPGYRTRTNPARLTLPAAASYAL